MDRDQDSNRDDQAARRHRLARVASSRARLAAENAATPGGVRRYEARQGRLAQVRRRDSAEERGWCILRTNSKRTIKLTESLNAAGIEAWTPRVIRDRRQPRRARRETPVVEAVEEPVIPTFVFARAQFLGDLQRVLALPLSPHPAFSIFQHAGRAPVVSDGELRKLRAIEETNKRARRKEQRHDIAVGLEVAPTEGAFAGLKGVVESVRGKIADVCFNDRWRVKVETWLLLDHHVDDTAIDGRQDRQRVAA